MRSPASPSASLDGSPNFDAWVANIAATAEVTQAGGHPDFTTAFKVADDPNFLERFTKDLFADRPPARSATPWRCRLARPMTSTSPSSAAARPKARWARSRPTCTTRSRCSPRSSSLVPAYGEPALLGFKAFGITALVHPRVRSDGDYGLSAEVEGHRDGRMPSTARRSPSGAFPTTTVHDSHRFDADNGGLGGSVSGTPIVPFASAPTNCDTGPLAVTVKARSWLDPRRWVSGDSPAPEPTGCDQIKFTPTLSAQPTTHTADQPTGLEVDVHTPQNNGSCMKLKFQPITKPQYDCGLATSHLKDTVVTLPPGLVINPSGANGLDGCSTRRSA